MSQYSVVALIGRDKESRYLMGLEVIRTFRRRSDWINEKVWTSHILEDELNTFEFAATI